MNPFLRYLADKNSAHTQTDRQTDRHTPMTTRPCGLRSHAHILAVRHDVNIGVVTHLLANDYDNSENLCFTTPTTSS